MNKVGLMFSVQTENKGIGKYIEAFAMQKLVKSMAKEFNKSYGKQVKCVTGSMLRSLGGNIDWMNKQKLIFCVDNHSDAGPSTAEGRTVFFDHRPNKGNSYKIAKEFYDTFGLVDISKGRGLKSDKTDRFPNGMGAIQSINCPGILIEHMFHTNKKEVQRFEKRPDDYVRAGVLAIVRSLDALNPKYLKL